MATTSAQGSLSRPRVAPGSSVLHGTESGDSSTTVGPSGDAAATLSDSVHRPSQNLSVSGSEVGAAVGGVAATAEAAAGALDNEGWEYGEMETGHSSHLADYGDPSLGMVIGGADVGHHDEDDRGEDDLEDNADEDEDEDEDDHDEDDDGEDDDHEDEVDDGPHGSDSESDGVGGEDSEEVDIVMTAAENEDELQEDEDEDEEQEEEGDEEDEDDHRLQLLEQSLNMHLMGINNHGHQAHMIVDEGEDAMEEGEEGEEEDEEDGDEDDVGEEGEEEGEEERAEEEEEEVEVEEEITGGSASGTAHGGLMATIHGGDDEDEDEDVTDRFDITEPEMLHMSDFFALDSHLSLNMHQLMRNRPGLVMRVAEEQILGGRLDTARALHRLSRARNAAFRRPSHGVAAHQNETGEPLLDAHPLLGHGQTDTAGENRTNRPVYRVDGHIPMDILASHRNHISSFPHMPPPHLGHRYGISASRAASGPGSSMSPFDRLSNEANLVCGPPHRSYVVNLAPQVGCSFPTL